MEEKVFRGYTEPELRAAFEKVEDKRNWKYPIAAEIPVTDYAITDAATVFYAGAKLRISRRPASSPDRIHVWSRGYYAAVGA